MLLMVVYDQIRNDLAPSVYSFLSLVFPLVLLTLSSTPFVSIPFIIIFAEAESLNVLYLIYIYMYICIF